MGTFSQLGRSNEVWTGEDARRSIVDRCAEFDYGTITSDEASIVRQKTLAYPVTLL